MPTCDPAANRFEKVVVIFNPEPAAVPAHLAESFRSELASRLPLLPVEMRPTAHAGHGRRLAREAASEGRVLIVSVSGDGGFNDVVNGVMDVPESQAVCAVMAAGNANDHRRSTRTMPLVDAVATGAIRHVDLLFLTIGSGASASTRYAHSYIGFGLTPSMAVGIEKAGKGRVRELLGVLRTLPGLRPFEIERADGARARFDSLVLANISGMAKYGTVSESSGLGDGKFEVVALPHASRWALALMTLRAVTLGLGPQQSVDRYAFTTLEGIRAQLDGELIEVPAASPVLVESRPRALAVIG